MYAGIRLSLVAMLCVACGCNQHSFEDDKRMHSMINNDEAGPVLFFQMCSDADVKLPAGVKATKDHFSGRSLLEYRLSPKGYALVEPIYGRSVEDAPCYVSVVWGHGTLSESIPSHFESDDSASSIQLPHADSSVYVHLRKEQQGRAPTDIVESSFIHELRVALDGKDREEDMNAGRGLKSTLISLIPEGIAQIEYIKDDGTIVGKALWWSCRPRTE